MGVPTQFLGEGPCPISISSPCTVYSGAHPNGSCLVPELKGLAERDCIYASPKKKKKKSQGLCCSYYRIPGPRMASEATKAANIPRKSESGKESGP